MGSKDAPCEHPSPANDFRTRPVCVCTSAPAFTLPPSAFTLLPHRLPRPPQNNRHPAAAVIHNGLSTEKLSTLLLAALCKTFSPSRLRTRIYNISFARRLLPGSVRVAPEKSPRRCDPVSRAAVRRVGEGEAKGGRPLAQCRTMPLVSRITVCKGGSAPGQPRPCPCVLPASACLRPRPCPLVCRITVHKDGSAPDQPRPCPCVLPATACLRPRPRPLMGESLCVLPAATCLRPRPRSLMGEAPCVLPATACLPPRPCPLMGEAPCAGWGRAKAKADAPSRSNPPLSVYRRVPAV